jgi:hypothetical protein
MLILGVYYDRLAGWAEKNAPHISPCLKPAPNAAMPQRDGEPDRRSSKPQALLDARIMVLPILWFRAQAGFNLL